MSHTSRRATLHASISISLALIVLLGACVRQGTGTPTDTNVTAVGLVALAPAPVLGIVIAGTMTVLYVEPGSGAQAAGILTGDVIRSVNRIELTQNLQGAKDEIRNAQPGQKIEIRGEREGQPFAVDVEPLAPRAEQLGQVSIPPTATPVIAPNDYL